MRVRVDTGGLDRVMLRLDKAKPDPSDWRELGTALEKVLVEDNRAGVLSGLDGNGSTMPAVRYRQGVAIRTRFRSLRSPEFGTKSGRFKGLRKARGRGLANNNLRSSQYRKLTGPPLAPRSEQSRVITNFIHRHQLQGTSRLIVEGGWRDVLSNDGTPFLIFHFTGSGRLPRRDLRGVRPRGKAEAHTIITAWRKRLLKSH